MAREIAATDTYTDRLHKLLPAELTAAYIAVRGQAGANPHLYRYTLLFSILISIVFFFVMPAMLSVQKIRTRLLYCVTFIVWVLALDADNFFLSLGLDLNYEDRFVYIASALGIVWSFSVPFLTKA